jgi:hypothetical protein
MNQECSNTTTDTHPTFRGLPAIAVGRTTVDRIREALQDLAYRSPVVITSRKRIRATERNAFVLGVDWGSYTATKTAVTSKAVQA